MGMNVQQLREAIANTLMRDPEAQKQFKDAVLATFDTKTGKPFANSTERMNWFVDQLTAKVMTNLKQAQPVFQKHLERQRADAVKSGQTKPNPLDPNEIELARQSQNPQPVAQPATQQPRAVDPNQRTGAVPVRPIPQTRPGDA